MYARVVVFPKIGLSLYIEIVLTDIFRKDVSNVNRDQKFLYVMVGTRRYEFRVFAHFWDTLSFFLHYHNIRS